MAKVVEFINLECVVCGRVELFMKIVDDISVCSRCFHVEFDTDDPPLHESEKYLKLVAKLEEKKMPKVGDYRYTEDGIEIDKVRIKKL